MISNYQQILTISKGNMLTQELETKIKFSICIISAQIEWPSVQTKENDFLRQHSCIEQIDILISRN